MTGQRSDRLQGISLDVWGTLIRSDKRQRVYRSEVIAPIIGWSGDPTAVTRAFSAASKRFDGLSEVTGVQHGTRERLEFVCSELGLPPLKDAQYAAAVQAMHESQMKYLPIFTEPDLPATLARWRDEYGLTLAIICNTGIASGELMADSLQALGVLDLVSFPLWSDHVGVAKPTKGIFDTLVKASGIPAGAWLHVGDNPRTDYQGGVNAGFNALRYTPKAERASDTTYLRHSELHTHPLFQTLVGSGNLQSCKN